MRVALTIVVVALLAFVGYGAATRLLDGEAVDDERGSAEKVAADWADAVGRGDVEALATLAADRADVEALRSTHTEVLPALSSVAVTVDEVSVDGNAATALLRTTAAPVPDAAWTWESTLDLIRSRGEWSVDWDATALHPDLAVGWRLRVDVLEASRAPVLDREGRALSRTGEVVEVGVQPGRLPDRDRVLVTVASSLPEAYGPLRDLLDRDDLRDDWYYPLTTVPVEVADEAWPDLLSLPGFLRRDGEAGVGEATAAAEVVGAIGLDDDGERIGTSGLERVFDDRLRGSATTEVRLLDPDGGERDVLYSFQQDVSPALVTTLDREIQSVVEEVVDGLDGAMAVVAVDPATGGVTAIASRPTTGFARALEGRYPPGAIAGLVPLAALFEDGAAVGDPLDCPAEGTAGGVTVTTRASGAPGGSLAEALTGACDVGLARLGATLGGDRLVAAAELLGFGQPVDLPLEATGSSWPATSSEAADASAAIGHAQVQTSALGAASLAAAVARGAPAPPVLLVEDVVEDVEPWPTVVTAGLREVMRTAGAAGDVGAPGVRTAGLTATTGAVRGDPAPRTGWWFGFLEGDGTDIALAVVVEGDERGLRAAEIADLVIDRLAR